MARAYLFPILGFACLAICALTNTAAYASPGHFIRYGFELMKPAALPLDVAAPLRLSARVGSPMRVPGMPSAERSGASVSLLNGPMLSPIRGFEIRSRV